MKKPMILIVGLGNPGKRFARTRHNIGFRVLDEFQRENNFSDFKIVKKFNSLISAGNFSDKKILLAKPQTFMNNSGVAVKLLTKTYNLKPKTLIVVHDDIDLPLGKIKIVKNRGSAGHKGVESIIKELRSKNFIRFRIGIGHETWNMKHKTKNAEKYVLEKFTKDEERIVKEIIKKSSNALKTALTEGIEKAMSKFNK